MYIHTQGSLHAMVKRSAQSGRSYTALPEGQQRHSQCCVPLNYKTGVHDPFLLSQC